MTDAEAHEYVVRTDAFIDDIFELLTNTQPVNPNAGSSWWRSRRPSTPSTTSTFATWRRSTSVMDGALLDAIELKLACVGAGPTLDYADAPAFFTELQWSSTRG